MPREPFDKKKGKGDERVFDSNRACFWVPDNTHLGEIFQADSSCPCQKGRVDSAKVMARLEVTPSGRRSRDVVTERPQGSRVGVDGGHWAGRTGGLAVGEDLGETPPPSEVF